MYLDTGESPDEFFMVEECRDAEEVARINERYRSIIIRSIRKQIAPQRRSE